MEKGIKLEGKKEKKEKRKMSVRMKLSFCSPPAEEHDKKFAPSVSIDSLEERKAEFKKDEELMRETTKFVSEVIETARLEAIRRAEQVSYKLTSFPLPKPSIP